METCIIKLINLSAKNGKFIGLGEITIDRGNEGIYNDRLYIENSTLDKTLKKLLSVNLNDQEIYCLADISGVEFTCSPKDTIAGHGSLPMTEYVHTSVEGGAARLLTIARVKKDNRSLSKTYRKSYFEYAFDWC